MSDLYHDILETLQSPENAIGQYDRIADEILTLNKFPNRYRFVVLLSGRRLV